MSTALLVGRSIDRAGGDGDASARVEVAFRHGLLSEWRDIKSSVKTLLLGFAVRIESEKYEAGNKLWKIPKYDQKRLPVPRSKVELGADCL